MGPRGIGALGSDICTCPRSETPWDQPLAFPTWGCIVPPGVKGPGPGTAAGIGPWGGIPPWMRGLHQEEGCLSQVVWPNAEAEGPGGLLVQQNVRSRTESRARARNGLRFPWDEWCYMNFTMQNFQSNLWIHDSHHYLCLQQRISQLRVFEVTYFELPGGCFGHRASSASSAQTFAPGKTSDCSGNRLRSIFWINGVPVG